MGERGVVRENKRQEGKTGGRGRIEGREKGGKEKYQKKKRWKRGDVRTKDEMERMRTCFDKQYMYIKAAWLQLYKCMHTHMCVYYVCVGRLHVHV